MSVANVKAKAPKKTSAKKVTDAEQAAVKAALEAGRRLNTRPCQCS